MKLLDNAALAALIKNGRRQELLKGTPKEIDFPPVVKLFTPDANATWLLTEIDPQDDDIAFGLCDLGTGFPELGSVRLSELAAVRGRLGLPIECDRSFKAARPISHYASEARRLGRISA